MKTTLAVDVRHTVGKKGAKAASAGSWIVGRHAIQDHAERIVAHDAGTKLMEFVSKSGGFINTASRTASASSRPRRSGPTT